MSSSKTIGIIGGGQLGQMMAISAIYMGHKVIALDPAADCPASRVAEIIVAPYNDVDALRQLAERCDVLTYEFENVDADGLDAVIKEGQLPQGTDLLRISQNRIFEKDFLSNKAQVTVAPYKVVTSSQDLADIDPSKNYVLKTATGGYDGHGQKVIRSEADLAEAYALADSADCVFEEFVNFDLEISVIVSGNGKDVTVFPVQENIHRNNILSKTIVPARISESLAEKAKAMAVRIAEQLNLSGTLCVEMFATADDIIVNEIAPRPHNSGHYSIEACDFSQFDTHILGVLGAPLPAIHLHAPAVMLNALGQHVEAAEQYVTENLNTYLRRGAGDQFKIAGAIQSGEAVTVLEQQGKYTLIRDNKNREAWILTSELSSTPSSREENPRLKAQVQELTLKLNRVDSDWQQRINEIQRRSKQAEQQSSELLEQNSQLKRELEMTKNKNRDLEAMLDAGKREIAIQWFIYGGSVLGVGLLIGLVLPHILPRRKRRDSW